MENLEHVSFDSWTDRARKTMSLANERGNQLRHAVLHTEHMLLGIIDEGRGIAAQVLKNLGVDPLMVKNMIESLPHMRPGFGDRQPDYRLPQSEATLAAIVAANKAAKALGHQYVGTEHVLLGILAGYSPACTLLRDLNLTAVAVEAEIMALLGRTEVSLDRAEASPATGEPVSGRWITAPYTTFTNFPSTTATANAIGPFYPVESKQEERPACKYWRAITGPDGVRAEYGADTLKELKHLIEWDPRTKGGTCPACDSPPPESAGCDLSDLIKR